MDECGRKFAHGQQRCKRRPAHRGLHRDARTVRHATIMWGDNECEPADNRGWGNRG
jgi:hypothetical protein